MRLSNPFTFIKILDATNKNRIESEKKDIVQFDLNISSEMDNIVEIDLKREFTVNLYAVAGISWNK